MKDIKLQSINLGVEGDTLDQRIPVRIGNDLFDNLVASRRIGIGQAISERLVVDVLDLMRGVFLLLVKEGASVGDQQLQVSDLGHVDLRPVHLGHNPVGQREPDLRILPAAVPMPTFRAFVQTLVLNGGFGALAASGAAMSPKAIPTSAHKLQTSAAARRAKCIYPSRSGRSAEIRTPHPRMPSPQIVTVLFLAFMFNNHEFPPPA